MDVECFPKVIKQNKDPLRRCTVEMANRKEASHIGKGCVMYGTTIRLKCSENHVTLHEAKPGPYFSK